MSLQLWFPFNGNLNNQGLSNFSPTVITTPTWGTGKVSNNCINSGEFSIPASAINSFYNNNHMTFAFWIYCNSSCSNGILFGTEDGQRLYSIFQNPTRNDLHLSWQPNSGGAILESVDTGVFPDNVWTHCAITYDGANANIYINGELKNTYSVNYSGRTNFNVPVNFFNNSNRYINDLRVYDEVLSPYRIKELAKGLCLHYKLYKNWDSSLIEPDCSGYGNDGTISGTVSYSNDSPRNTGSVGFNYNSGIKSKSIPSGFPITISFWAKVSQFDTDGWVVLAGQSTSYCLDADANSSANWHSYASVSKYYRDGSLITSDNTTNQFISRDGNWHHYTYICTLNSWSQLTINGGYLWGSGWRANSNMSDFRVYATELSEKDIKELYNTPIRIDNKNILYCNEFKDIDTDMKFYKTGVIEKEIKDGKTNGFEPTNIVEI